MAKRLIDADVLIKAICNSCDGYCDKVDCDCLNCKRTCRCELVQEIVDAPTVDAVEVVRCRDCKYIYFNKAYNSYLCRNTNGLTSHLKADYFCSYGERRTNE